MARPKPGPIVVVGSVNIDLVCRTPRLPHGGETILGKRFATVPGGKGANQAVAAARLGAEVHLVGRVGDDHFAVELLANLRAADVDTGHVKATPGHSSGCAMILVDDAGQNSIVVVPGANAMLTPADVDAARDLIARASVVVLQLEVPLTAVARAIEVCRELGAFTILDPAPVPAGGLPPALYKVDILSPNQNEAAQLVGGGRGEELADDSVTLERAGKALARRGVRTVAFKLGAAGAAIFSPSTAAVRRVPPSRAEVIDTTAAGDAFTGALAVAVAEGMPVRAAVRFANAAGALACEVFGAQPSLPGRQAVESRLRRG